MVDKMKIDVTEGMTIRLKEVFNSVLFETEEGEKLVVCMRDGGFEIGIKDPTAKSLEEKKAEEYYSWYRIIDGEIALMVGANVDIGDKNNAGRNDSGN